MWEGKCSKEFQLKTKTSPRRFMCFILKWGSQSLLVILYLITHAKYPIIIIEWMEGVKFLMKAAKCQGSWHCLGWFTSPLDLWEKLAKWMMSPLPAYLSSNQCSGRFSCIELFEYDKLLIKVLKLVIKKGSSRECSNSSVGNSLVH